MRNAFLFVLLLSVSPVLRAQRFYASNSVLASGDWYKISVSQTGVYKIDAAFLHKLGIRTDHLSSRAIRLFGNGGSMLPEACNGFKNDDLLENSIEVHDGGDGLFNNNDYFLFYGSGPGSWIKDSANQRFKHQQNLYSTQAFYFINIGDSGKRVQQQTGTLLANTNVTSFSERFVHELDSVNFLNSSKDWYGEELSSLPGHSPSQSFTIPLSDINTEQPAILVSSVAARTIGSNSRFSITANARQILEQPVDGVGSTNLDLFAKNSVAAASFNASANITVSYHFEPGASGAEGWIDWFEIFC